MRFVKYLTRLLENLDLLLLEAHCVVVRLYFSNSLKYKNRRT